MRLLALLFVLLTPLAASAKPVVLDRVVAVVNDSVITHSQLDERLTEIRQQMSDSKQPAPPADILQKQVLESMILNDIQMQLAGRAGINIDDASLNDALTGIASRNHLTLAQFADKIRGEGLDWASFREQIRQQIAINQLRQGEVGRRVHVSDKEVEQFMKSAQGKKLFSYDLHLAHILVQVPDKASKEQLQAAQAKADEIEKKAKSGVDFSQLAIRYSNAEDALKGGDLGWRPASELPSLFTQACETLKPGQVSAPLKAGNGFHIIKLIDRRGNNGAKMVQQYQVRHILIKSDTLRTPEQAHQLADKLHAEALAGKSFADLARQYSADPGSAAQGGELGWVSPGDMVQAFDAMMQATPVGKLSPVFHTQFGWHFLEVEATRNADMSKQYQRNQAANALHARYYDEQLQLWLRKIRSEAYVDIRL